MRAFWSLVKQHLRLNRLTTIIWLLIIAMMAYVVAGMSPSVVADNNLTKILGQFPKAFQRLFGNINAYRHPVDIFIQGKWLLFMPLLAGIFGVLSAMGIMAREIDRRTADFVLTLPVKRSLVLAARFTALALGTGLLYLAAVVMVWLGLKQANLAGSVGNYFLFSLGHYCLTLFFAAVTLCLSLLLEDYAVANRYALIGVVGFYALFLILKGSGASIVATGFSLFGLTDPEKVIAYGRFPWLGVFILIPTMIVLWLSMHVMNKKQVPA